jgi:hypothetical protein
LSDTQKKKDELLGDDDDDPSRLVTCSSKLWHCHHKDVPDSRVVHTVQLDDKQLLTHVK